MSSSIQLLLFSMLLLVATWVSKVAADEPAHAALGAVAEGKWSRVNGSSKVNVSGVYGQRGVAAAGNQPGARYGAATWVDARGRLWLFGGYGYDVNGSGGYGGYLNDLWRFEPVSRLWTWVSGASTWVAPGVYGVQWVAAAGNQPGARIGALTWTDAEGKFWLFGGWGSDSHGQPGAVSASGGWLNDLWRFDPGTGLWTWVSGSVSVNSRGVYGVRGVGAPGNQPSARRYAAGWMDKAGALWLFGGEGYGSSDGGDENLDDVWRFDPASKRWAWICGDTSGRGVAAQRGRRSAVGANNDPGSRAGALTWTDAAGGFWLFGGGHGEWGRELGLFNDVWSFDPGNGQWTWVSGPASLNQSGVYGKQGIAAAGNSPGARIAAFSWVDAKGGLWLWGGSGYDGNVTRDDLGEIQGKGFMNDFWRFDPKTRFWTWSGGSSSAGNTSPTQAALNQPDVRSEAARWVDASGKLLLFGGQDATGSGGLHNHLWSFSPHASQ